MFTLQPTILRDGYIEFNCPRASYVIINVYNGGCYCGVGRSVSGRAGDNVYQAQDMFLAPGSNPVFGADSLRFRRADPTNDNTQVTVQANLDEELPEKTALNGIYMPNYLILERNGRVSADFSGIIRAAGISLRDGPAQGLDNAESMVAWYDSVTGRAVIRNAVIASDNDRIEPGSASAMLAGTTNRTGRSIAAAVINSRSGEQNSTYAYVDTVAQRVILRGHNGSSLSWSDYVQWLLPTNPYKIDFGVRNVAWNANFNNITFSLNESFSTSGIAVFVTFMGWTGGTPTLQGANFPNLQEVTIAMTAPGAGSGGLCYLAIGY